MKKSKVLALAAMALLAATTHAPASAADTKEASLTPMPEALEVRLALSALPPALRNDATVHVLDPAKGYRPVGKGSSGVTCIVQRTVWESGELRDDIYIPLCYDAAGTSTYLKVIMDAAALRAQGVQAGALKAEIDKRWADGTYKVPDKAGVSYMLAPVQRTISPPDLQVHTVTMPHVMFYAPGVTHADLGAKPDLANHASLMYPFIDRQGNDEQSYIIQMIGAAEKAENLAEHQDLLRDLCAHDAALCLTQAAH
jgi:hypothetical protein